MRNAGVTLLFVLSAACGARTTRVASSPNGEARASGTTGADPQLDQAIGFFEREAELNPSLARLYNLALAYEVAGRYDDARRLVVRMRRIDPIPEGAAARLSQLEERLDARARGESAIETPMGRDAIIEGGRREQERLRCGGNDMHP